MKNKKNTRNSQDSKSQDFLYDYKKSGKLRPWDKRKAITDEISRACFQIPGLERYGEMMCSCGSFLGFEACVILEHGKVLKKASFCKYRLCVMCQSRKAVITRKQVFDLASWHLEKYPNDAPLLLTLTIPNVSGENIGKTIDRMTKAFERLSKRKVVKGMNRSWFKSLEITYNRDRVDFHPHFHVLMMVPPEYFRMKSGLYITHGKWLNLWQEAMRDSTITQVDVRKIKDTGEGKLEAIIAEVAKYATKPSSYVFENDCGELEVDNQALEHLHYGLKGRRLIGYGGYFKEVRKEKRLLDVEESDLVSVDEEEIDEDGVVKESSQKVSCCKICNLPLVEENYHWTQKIKRYLRICPKEDGSERYRSGLETVQCRGPT